MRKLFVWLICLAAVGTWAGGGLPAADAADVPPNGQHDPVLAAPVATQTLLAQYCVSCHTGSTPSGDLMLQSSDSANANPNGKPEPITLSTTVWERVVRKLRSGQMPPADADQPEPSASSTAIAHLERALDEPAEKHPRPGRTETLRRLTRTEYANAVRDLLDLRINAEDLLPVDEASHGFDNITVGELSPALLNRYVTAAQKIARMAVGSPGYGAVSETYRVRPDITQEHHLPGLPLGTRGGTLIPHNFPRNGNYEIQVRLTRDRNEHVEGLNDEHELVVLVDRREAERFVVRPPKDRRDHSKVDAHLHTTARISSGPHDLAVTFAKRSASLIETERQPTAARFNMHRHPRTGPAILEVTITGPIGQSDTGDSPSRHRLFAPLIAETENGENGPKEGTPAETQTPPRNDESRAKDVLRVLTRRAYRREVSDDDLAGPLQFFRNASAGGDFDAGIEAALASVLVNPSFLFRVERDPEGLNSGAVYRISDVELASRLSFFLWSSIPDDELLDVAVRGEFNDPETLRRQADRMLADPKSESLVTNFADQWLYLRNLESVSPDMRLFPDFDDNLRQAMRTETEMFFADIVRQDRSVTELLQADYTFLNERLARHYGIPHVYGDRFRRVELPSNSDRGGLLRHGSILTVTSYATRTSPVIRGHWILKNLIGAPPPPPPANVPALKDNTVLDSLPIRGRLAQHRRDPNCAGCHNLMDPVGFALEGYDAVGRRRLLDGEYAVDTTGGLPGMPKFEGVDGLENGLLQRPELFVGTLVEKLLTYATGRGLTEQDAPAVRKIVRKRG